MTLIGGGAPFMSVPTAACSQPLPAEITLCGDDRERQWVPTTLGHVFGRRRSPETPQATSAATATTDKAGGKGRPTPKRREAEAARVARVKPAANRREALKRDRAAAREERLKSRQALMAGDERHLPPRDQGPVKKYVRDFVDSRRSAAEFFFWIAIVVLVGTFFRPIAPYITLFWFVALIIIVVDSAILMVRLRGALKRKFSGESTRGVTTYALLRAMQIRKLRLPPPRVKPGARI
jgi:hypothetical protein